jgi:hypothetical protein
MNNHELAAKENETHEKLTGLPLVFADERYFPRRRKATKENPNEHLEFGSLEKTFSGVKPPQSNTRPVIYDDIDTTFRKWMQQATTYAYVTPALERARMLLAHPDVRQALDKAASKTAIERLHDTYSGIEGFSTIPEKGPIQRFLEKAQTLYHLWGNITGAVGTRVYASGMAATKLSMDHDAASSADFLLHSALSAGPTKLLAKGEAAMGIDSLHAADVAKAERMMAINGHFAERWGSTIADTTETAVAGLHADDLTGKGWVAAFKSWKQHLDSRGLRLYLNADKKTAVEVAQWGERNGMTEKEATDYALEHIRSWAPPSNEFDYTRDYLRSLWVRLAVPFTGAITRISAMGTAEVARLRQAETPAETRTAALRLAKFAAGVGVLSLTGSAYHQALYDWKRGKDWDTNKALENAAFDALSMGGFPYSGRIGEELVSAFEHKEDPSKVTTVAGAGDVVYSIATLNHAIEQEGNIDWSDPKNREAGAKLAEGAAGMVQIQLRGIDENMRVLFPKEKN